MRTIGKILLGLLSVVGFLTLLLVGLSIYAVTSFRGNSPQTPVSGRAVLALDLDDNFVEGTSGRKFENLGLKSQVSLHDTLLAIKRAKTDSHVVAIKASLSSPSLGLAQIQELREAVADFRASGKPAYLYSETIGEGDGALPGYYLASAFGDIWVQPSGTVGIAGIGTEEFFLKKFLDRFGLKASFVQRKEFKSAPETFTATSMSAPNREAMTALIGSWFEQITSGIAADRKLDQAAVKAAVDKGPLLAREALDAKLIDHLGYRDEFDAAVKGASSNATEITLARYVGADLTAKKGTQKRVAVIHAVGEIDRAKDEGEFLPSGGVHAERTSKAIRRAAEDRNIAAILLRVDSPGGSYVASDTIWREIIKAKEKNKPVIVSMGNLAASGGYFIAMPADRIFADGATITGSIGVFSGKVVIDQALAKLDIGHDQVTVGESAGMFSATRDFSARDLARLNEMLDATYADFTGKAAQGRGKSPDEIEALAKGRVWSGADAVKNGLVDEQGGFIHALDYVKTKIGLKPDDQVALVPFPTPQQPWQTLFRSLEDDDLPLTALGFMGKLQWLEARLAPFMAMMNAATAEGHQLRMEPIAVK
ncbi:MAG: signal peptide peptidase SppA [Rhodospirillaceae bacterium]|nr:signal peptide peptidase SppA [Rhodospirillaceae bacterium]